MDWKRIKENVVARLIWSALAGAAYLAWSYRQSASASVGGWLGTDVTLPRWVVLLVVVAIVALFVWMAPYWILAFFSKRKPPKPFPEIRIRSAPEPSQAPKDLPHFKLTKAQIAIVTTLATKYPASLSPNELHYGTGNPTQAHTQHDIEELSQYGVVETGASLEGGQYVLLTREGRNYAIKRGLYREQRY